MKKNIHFFRLLYCLVIIHCLILGFANTHFFAESITPVSKRSISISALTPADVLARVGLFRDELELIRLHVGKPKFKHLGIQVTDVDPQHAYFQSKTLFNKAERFAFERTRQHGERLEEYDVGNIKPFHVFVTVDAALERLYAVKRKLSIDEMSDEIEQDESASPTDVFASIMQANNQLNLLLENQYASSDVFQVTNLAISLTANILDKFPSVLSLPNPPPYVSNKVPADNFLRMINCFELLTRIGTLSGLEMSKIDVKGVDFDTIDSSDVYDMGSLVVSELSRISSKLSSVDEPQQIFYPGAKFPSETYQRIGVLEEQLLSLLELAQINPEWISE